MNYQFLTYAESKGFDVANMTAQEIDALKQALLLGKLTLPYVEIITNYDGAKVKLLMKLYDFRALLQLLFWSKILNMIDILLSKYDNAYIKAIF